MFAGAATVVKSELQQETNIAPKSVELDFRLGSKERGTYVHVGVLLLVDEFPTS